MRLETGMLGLGEETRLAGADKVYLSTLASGGILAICLTLGVRQVSPARKEHTGFHAGLAMPRFPSLRRRIDSPLRSPGVTRPKAVTLSQMKESWPAKCQQHFCSA